MHGYDFSVVLFCYHWLFVMFYLVSFSLFMFLQFILYKYYLNMAVTSSAPYYDKQYTDTPTHLSK